MKHEISVIVPTRNRGDSALRTAESILGNQYSRPIELLIIDQSTDGETLEAFEKSSLVHDPRLTYHPINSIGVSNARNAGVEISQAPLIAFTDDDCVVPNTWLQQLEEVFVDPEVDLYMSPLEAGFPTQNDEFIPEFLPENSGQLNRNAGISNLGLTANMMVRRRVFEELKGFDPYLGAGSDLKSAEDTDFILRALESELGVFVGLEPTVLHFGVRKTSDMNALIRDSFFGMGAMLAKHGRSGEMNAWLNFIKMESTLLTEATFNMLKSGRPTGLRSALAMVKGVVTGLKLPMDKQDRLFTSLVE